MPTRVDKYRRGYYVVWCVRYTFEGGGGTRRDGEVEEVGVGKRGET